MRQGFNRTLLNRYSMGTALALVAAPFAGVGGAEALPACTLTGPTVVTCSGSPITSGDPHIGYDGSANSNFTYNIDSTALVTGSHFGLQLGFGAGTINVDGQIFGDQSAGLNGGNLTLINNANGVISSNNSAVTANTVIVTNNGQIIGIPLMGGIGLEIVGGTITNAVVGGSPALISAGSFGIDLQGTSITVSNGAGATIKALAANGAAIGVDSINTHGIINLSNAGLIQAIATGGIGINAGTLNLTSNTGTIQGDTFGIQALDGATVTNDGATALIKAGGAGGVAISGPAVTLSNAGFVEALASGGIDISGGTVNVTSNTGAIVGDAFAIKATGVATVTNNADGIIQANAASGVAIQAGSVNVNNAGAIEVGATGSTAISSTGDVTVTNSGTISAAVGASHAIDASGNITLTNSGLITAGGSGLHGSGLVSVTNTGTITAVTSAIFGANGVTVDNSGSISSAGAGKGAIEAGNGDITVTNSGTIANAVGYGILNDGTFGTINVSNAATGTITGAVGIVGVGAVTLGNAGLIQSTAASGAAVESGSDAVNILANTGTIQATGASSWGIKSGTAATVNNAGVISGVTFGIQAGTAAAITNAGSITATGSGGIGILAGTTANITANSGTIAGDGFGISAAGAIAIASNSGTISSASGDAINGGATVTATNSGTISAAHGNAIFANTDATVTNLAGGHLTAGIDAIKANGNVVVNNAGAIAGGDQGIVGLGSSTTVVNSGSITGGTGEGILSNGVTNVTNNAGGTITGAVGIQAAGAATITNAGTISSSAGASGTAIQLSAASDTLNLKASSVIIGKIDLGGGTGTDTINVEALVAAPRGVSRLFRSVSAVVDALKAQIIDPGAAEIINVISVALGGSQQPSVTVGGTTASLDPTALSQQDRTLVDFTGASSSLVQGRLNSASSSAGGMMAMAYAPEDASDNATTSSAKTSTSNAMAQMFTKAPATGWSNAPITVWSSGFGGVRDQSGTDTTLSSHSSVYGGAIGVDRRVRPDWLVGLFAGGGSGTLNVDLSSQKVDTDYFFVGAYSRFEWASQFIDFTVQGGGTNNRSTRLVQNTVTGGLENATASYNGWFISPEVAYGYHFDIGNGYTLTPTARVRYVAGMFDGYSETGSAQTLSIGSRTLQDFEERGELEVSRVTSFFGGDHTLKTTFHGGVIALQRTGDSNISAILIGQNLSFATPGKGSAVGAVAGASFDYHTSANVALFGAVEGIAMSDQSHTGTARGGVRVAF
jgi:uncharacterized protein with beta-barrel porin domain